MLGRCSRLVVPYRELTMGMAAVLAAVEHLRRLRDDCLPANPDLLALLLSVGPGLPIWLAVRILIDRQVSRLMARRQVISSVGHPLGYPGFFGGRKGLPVGRSK